MVTPLPSGSSPMTNRYCFQLQVNPDQLDEYRDRHRRVWPEMLVALRDTGWSNYSLFLSDDGLLIGYVESHDLEAARAAMAETDANTRWQNWMAPLFVDLPTGRADESLQVLTEVFNLADQLAANDLPELPEPPRSRPSAHQGAEHPGGTRP